MKKKKRWLFFDFPKNPLCSAPSSPHLEQLGRDELTHATSRPRDEHELSGLDDASARSEIESRSLVIVDAIGAKTTSSV